TPPPSRRRRRHSGIRREGRVGRVRRWPQQPLAVPGIWSQEGQLRSARVYTQRCFGSAEGNQLGEEKGGGEETCSPRDHKSLLPRRM
ncbi:hypothetical protein JRQ81_015860, partial [Phrynocephalus forsythii]